MSNQSIKEEVYELAMMARRASEDLSQASLATRNAALAAMAQALRVHREEILEANAKDVQAAKAKNTKESLVDRLLLTEDRIEDMACALEDLVALADPVGRIQQEYELYNGIQLQRISVPLGVVAVVYEARPNVTTDAAGICLKAGNACILRGGSMAAHSNAVISNILHTAAQTQGLPKGCIVSLGSTDRQASDALMQLHGIVDVLIPRGGAGLIRHCVDCSKVPVIETGTGNCHVYLHASADPARACDILVNAKCRRFGVCNAAETLLVDKSVAANLLPPIFAELAKHEALLHCDDLAFSCAEKLAESGELKEKLHYVEAEESDWETEYLAPELAVRCVEGPNEAIEHINRYGTKHSEAIVADEESEEGKRAIETFLARVDAAAVYANASTAFTDGGQFGLGAEIGISTQKLHARGPFALDALTSYKYVLRGQGQVRA